MLRYVTKCLCDTMWCLWDEMSCDERSVQPVMSVWRNAHVTKCPVTKGLCHEMSLWQNICDEMFVTKCPVTKCPVTKSPVTRCLCDGISSDIRSCDKMSATLSLYLRCSYRAPMSSWEEFNEVHQTRRKSSEIKKWRENMSSPLKLLHSYFVI